MTLFSKFKRPLVLIILVVALVISGALTPLVDNKEGVKTQNAQAANRQTLIHFYSDASFTTVVGSKRGWCNGSVTYSGQVTAYAQLVFEEPCCGTMPC